MATQPEIVNIATLKINVDDVLKQSVKLQRSIDDLKKKQKDLDRTTEEGEAAYQKYNAQLKQNQKSLRDNQKFVQSLETANKDLNKSLEVEGKTRQQLYDDRARLNQISKQIKGETEEEIETRNRINEAINKQTQRIKELSPEYIKQKEQIGDYKNQIIEAVRELEREQKVLKQTKDELIENLEAVEEGTEEYEEYSKALMIVNKDLEKVEGQLDENTDSFDLNNLSIQGVIESSQKAGGATNLLTSGVKATTKSVIGLTKSALAFIATPIGIVLAAIAGAFLLVRNAMNRSEESTAKIRTAFAGFSGILKAFQKILEPVGNFLIDVFAAGLTKIANLFAQINPEIEESIKQSQELAKAELALDKAQRIARKTQLEYQKDAEKLRQLRDDEAKTIPERIKANEELGKVLDKQLKEEEALIQKAIDLANLRIKLEGETKEALDELAAAETELADIEERIEGQRSEQLVNRNQLLKEASALRVANMQAELEAFQKQAENEKGTLEDLIKFARIASEKEKAIAKEELNIKAITQEQYKSKIEAINADLYKSIQEFREEDKKAELEVAKEKEEKAQELTEKNIEAASYELDQYILLNQSKLDNDKYYSEESVKVEEQRLNDIFEKEKEFQQKRLELGQATQEEYNAIITQLTVDNQENLQELRKGFEEAEKTRLAIDSQNRLNLLESELNNSFEIELANLNRNKELELQEAETTGASVLLIEQKYAALKKQLDKDVQTAQIDGFKQIFDSYANLLGEQTAAGKAAAIASTTIATYQSATNAYNSLAGIPVVGVGLGIAAAAAAVLSGLSNVRKIASTPTKFNKGGVLKGATHSQGGIPFTVNGVPGFEAQNNEIVLTDGVYNNPLLRSFASELNVAGGGRSFASGGVAGITSRPSSGSNDLSFLTDSITKSLKSMPNPIVSVEEINRVGNNVNVVENIATT